MFVETGGRKTNSIEMPDARLSDTLPIDASHTVRDVLMRYPTTGPIFLQYGPMSTPRSGELYLRYEGLTLAKYAALNGKALEPLLRLLNAAAESEVCQPAAGDDPYRRGPATGSVGYTGSYREPDPNVEFASVVEVQTARGPE